MIQIDDARRTTHAQSQSPHQIEKITVIALSWVRGHKHLSPRTYYYSPSTCLVYPIVWCQTLTPGALRYNSREPPILNDWIVLILYQRVLVLQIIVILWYWSSLKPGHHIYRLFKLRCCCHSDLKNRKFSQPRFLGAS